MLGPTSRARTLRRLSVLALQATAVVCALLGAGCRGCERSADAPADSVFALLPPAATTILAFDVERIRTSPLWRALVEGAPQRPEDRRLLADAKARTGFDPLQDLHRLVIAFPDDARVLGEFAIVVEGENMDERRLIAYARDEAKVRGMEIVQEQHAAQRLWVGRDPQVRRTAFFPKPGTLVVAGGGWAERMAELASAAGKGSVAEDGQLPRLLERLGREHAVWAATIVSGLVRAQLAADPRFDAAAAVARLAIAVSLHNGVAIVARAESSTEEHARALAAQMDRYLLEARQSPKILLLGLGPWLQGVRVHAEGPVVTAHLTLDGGQTSTLAARLSGLMQWARAGRAP